MRETRGLRHLPAENDGEDEGDKKDGDEYDAEGEEGQVLLLDQLQRRVSYLKYQTSDPRS